MLQNNVTIVASTLGQITVLLDAPWAIAYRKLERTDRSSSRRVERGEIGVEEEREEEEEE